MFKRFFTFYDTHNSRVGIKQEHQVLIFCNLGAGYSDLAPI
jgi:hypothetical protein